MSKVRICEAKGCGRLHHAGGYCQKHYREKLGFDYRFETGLIYRGEGRDNLAEYYPRKLSAMEYVEGKVIYETSRGDGVIGGYVYDRLTKRLREYRKDGWKIVLSDEQAEEAARKNNVTA